MDIDNDKRLMCLYYTNGFVQWEGFVTFRDVAIQNQNLDL